MESDSAILAFKALAQATRLHVFRLLTEHEPDGLPAGEIARHLAVPRNTMSTHLAILTRAGLIEAERRSRSIIYRARLDTVRDLMGSCEGLLRRSRGDLRAAGRRPLTLLRAEDNHRQGGGQT